MTNTKCGSFYRALLAAAVLGATLLAFPAASIRADDAQSDDVSAPGVESGHYLFAYFKGNGEDGVHYALSRDGYQWTPLNGDKAILAPPVGKTSRLTRDPSITRGPDGVFRMTWTVSWDGQSFGYARSNDLVTWTDAAPIPAMQHEPTTRNTWAPEVFYDDATEQFYIFWSSTIPGRYSPADQGTSETKYDHRVYFTTTKDFETFAPTKLFFDPKHNVIDAYVAKVDDEYRLFYKDETLFPEAKKIILEAKAESIEGPYSEGKQISAQNWVEGPCSLTIGDDLIVYYDCYRDNKYGAVRSRDGGEWEDVGSLVSFPKSARHGCALKIEKEIYDNLVKTFGF